jgi:hypothetical protein
LSPATAAAEAWPDDDDDDDDDDEEYASVSAAIAVPNSATCGSCTDTGENKDGDETTKRQSKVRGHKP